MSFEEYQQVDHPEPYLYKLSAASGALLYVGSRHSFDPADPQMEAIEEAWRDFDPEVAYTEGSPVADDSLSRDEFVERYGEMGLTWWLAARDEVPVHTLDPTRRGEILHLRNAGWSDEQLMLFYTLRHVAQPQHGLTRTQLENAVPQYLQSLLQRYGLQGPETLVEFEEAVARVLPDVGDWTTIPVSYFHPGPQNPNFITNEISTASNHFRDTHHVDLLTRTVKSGQRVFAISGSAHAVMQEPALRDELTDR